MFACTYHYWTIIIINFYVGPILLYFHIIMYCIKIDGEKVVNHPMPRHNIATVVKGQGKGRNRPQHIGYATVDKLLVITSLHAQKSLQQVIVPAANQY